MLKKCEEKNFSIRKVVPDDAEVLFDLYFNHLKAYAPKESNLFKEKSMAERRDMIARFEQDSLYHLLVGEYGGRIVSSVTLIIIENLTYNLSPYALIENVVTHSDFRGRHYASALMERAVEIAKEHGCYKIMLMTGSKKDSTLQFYENCGFNRHEKTGFIKRL